MRGRRGGGDKVDVSFSSAPRETRADSRPGALSAAPQTSTGVWPLELCLASISAPWSSRAGDDICAPGGRRHHEHRRTVTRPQMQRLLHSQGRSHGRGFRFRAADHQRRQFSVARDRVDACAARQEERCGFDIIVVSRPVQGGHAIALCVVDAAPRQRPRTAATSARRAASASRSSPATVTHCDRQNRGRTRASFSAWVRSLRTPARRCYRRCAHVIHAELVKGRQKRIGHRRCLRRSEMQIAFQLSIGVPGKKQGQPPVGMKVAVRHRAAVDDHRVVE